jgi:Alpha/beta hydrolase of unknown function (DUF900)
MLIRWYMLYVIKLEQTFITFTVICIAVLIIIFIATIRTLYVQAKLISDEGQTSISYKTKELSLADPPLQNTKQIVVDIGSSYNQLPKILNVGGDPGDVISGRITTRLLPGGHLLVPSGPTKPEKPVYLISTIGTSTYYSYSGDLSRLYLKCPEEVAILIHGWNPNPLSKVKDFNRASMSIDANRYHIPTIGVLWPSDNTLSSSSTALESLAAWTTAKENAFKTGPKLGQFLTDFKDHCKDTTIHIVAHSLGARVIDSMLSSLGSNVEWKSSGYQIGTIQFLGAAISSNMPDIHATGAFIQDYVGSFYNLYSSADHLLKEVYPLAERFDKALGQTGATPGITIPTNYKDMNVTKEIPANNDAEGDGVCDASTCDIAHIEKGQNHLGYWGFVDSRGGHFIDDGAMNVVVANWKKIPPFKVDRTRDIIPSGPIYEQKRFHLGDNMPSLNQKNLTANNRIK